MINYFLYPHTFTLESGESLDQLKIAYSIIGNPKADKTIWVCHALSGNTDVTDWWSGLFGPDKLFNFNDYRIICANVIGSCYGSTNASNTSLGLSFPLITIKDIARSLELLGDYLNVKEIDVLIGASLGGQQALEWLLSTKIKVDKLILVATNAVHSAFGKAFNESQRLALSADPTFGLPNGGLNGLKAARAIAMLSYRSYTDFKIKQSDTESGIQNYKAASYVDYQGEKFIKRFDALSYYSLTKAMDSHDVGRGRGSIQSALSKVPSKTLVIGVNSDLLFPLSEQQLLANQISGAELGVIDSEHGHDAFLIEYEQIEKIIKDFLHNDFRSFKPTILKTANK